MDVISNDVSNNSSNITENDVLEDINTLKNPDCDTTHVVNNVDSGYVENDKECPAVYVDGNLKYSQVDNESTVIHKNSFVIDNRTDNEQFITTPNCLDNNVCTVENDDVSPGSFSQEDNTGCEDIGKEAKTEDLFIMENGGNVSEVYNKGNVVEFKPSKRTSIVKLLDFESFRFDVYRNQNQAGFITDRPYVWIKALDTYAHSDGVTCRWEIIKKKKDGKYSEVRMHTCFMENKCVTISIKLATGNINIKGSHMKVWIQKDFDAVRSLVYEIDTKEVQEDANEVIDGEKPPVIDLDDEKVNVKTEEENELNVLLVSHEIIKSSIKTIDTALTELNSRITENKERSDDLFAQIEKKLLSLDKRVDDKICVFHDELEKQLKAKIEATTKNLDNKVGSLKQVFNNLKVSVETKISNSTEDNTADEEKITDFNRKISKIEEDVAKIDVSGMSKTLTGLREDNEKDMKEINETFSRIKSQLATRESSEIELRRKVEALTRTASTTLQYPTSGRDSYDRHARDEKERSTYRHVADKEIDLMMCIDSNGKHLTYKKLWTMKGTRIKRCGKISEVNDIIDDLDASSNLKYFFISVGCNDLDVKSPRLLVESIKVVVEKLKGKFPGIRIILSEITPRNDNLDDQVKETNYSLNVYAKECDDIFMVDHSNMRDPDFFDDNKHFKESIMPRFASNIKRGLRRAYGMFGRDQKRGSEEGWSNGSHLHRTTFNQRSSVQHNNSNNNINNKNNDDSNNIGRSSEKDLKHIINTFKAGLLKKITEAFEILEL